MTTIAYIEVVTETPSTATDIILLYMELPNPFGSAGLCVSKFETPPGRGVAYCNENLPNVPLHVLNQKTGERKIIREM